MICKIHRKLLSTPYWDVLFSTRSFVALYCALEFSMSTYLFTQRSNDVAIWTTNNWRRRNGLARPFDRLFLMKWSLLLIFDVCFFLFLNHFLDAISSNRKESTSSLVTILDGRFLMDSVWTYRISFFSRLMNVLTSTLNELYAI